MKHLNNPSSQNSKFPSGPYKKNTYEIQKKNTIKPFFQWVLGIFFLLAAISAILHPLLLLIWGSIGFIIIPPGHHFLEKKFRIRLSRKLTIMIIVLLYIAAIPLSNYYSKIEEQHVVVQKPVEQKPAIKKTNHNDDKHEQNRKDSLELHLKRSDALLQKHKIKDAEEQLKLATTFAITEDEQKQIKAKETDTKIISIEDFMKAHKYAAALTIINDLLVNDPDNSMILLNRAICYSKTGNTQKAVEDLKPLLTSGNKEAEKLNDKINPVRKKVVGYETLCNDGSTSEARGRGACSHHGGVQDWNHPIYEESRQYE